MSDTKKRRARSTGGVYERGGVLYIRFKFEGKDYRESSGSRRKGDAKDLLEARIRELRDGTFSPVAQSVTLETIMRAVLADYAARGRRSVDRAEGVFANLERIMGADTPAAVVARKIPSYVATRLSETIPTRKKANPDGEKGEDKKPPKTIAGTTINRELSTLRRGFRLAKVRHLWPMDYEPLPEAPARKGFPEPEEVERIIGHLPARLKGPIRFASITGFRIRECLRLEWRSVDIKAGTIRLESGQTKGGEIRLWPFAEHPQLAALMTERKALTEAWERAHATIVPWVFWHEADGAAAPNVAYQYSWNRACRKAGYPGRLVHDLRRYAARNLIRSGVDQSVAMKLLGHATPSIFRRYNVTDERDLRQAVQNLAASARAASQTKQA
jgi:integrase